MDKINGFYFSGDATEKSLKKAVAKATSGIDGAVVLLQTINRASNLTHTERKAMTELVIMALQNVIVDTAAIANNNEIPF